MTDLSPAAQIVLDVAIRAAESPYAEAIAAAALRAAAKQLATYAGVQDGYQRHLIDVDALLAIAAELEQLDD